jgi:hypothetical protein
VETDWYHVAMAPIYRGVRDGGVGNIQIVLRHYAPKSTYHLQISGTSLSVHSGHHRIQEKAN